MRHAPASTFKIALSLIGFDSGILKNHTSPIWKLPENTNPYLNKCKIAQSPQSWMKNSCLWYSNVLTQKLGMKKFQQYINQFNYGNMDLSSGIKSSWISASLKISPIEQLNFLRKIVNEDFHISKYSYTQTKNIMYLQNFVQNFQLFSKTGTCKQIIDNKKSNLQHGWFVGYIEKNLNHNNITNNINNTITKSKDIKRFFVISHIIDTNPQNDHASIRAKKIAIEKLKQFLTQQR